MTRRIQFEISILFCITLVACGGTLDTHGLPPDSNPDGGGGGIIDPPPETDPTSAEEECGDGMDNNANEKIDEGCGCGPGASQSCYTGSAATRGVGSCHDGQQTCEGDNEFGQWGECTGSVEPEAEEICHDSLDNDCDGEVDEECGPVIPVHHPLPCTVQSLTRITGVTNCAANMAVYMVDDGNGPHMVCCPLPANDILSTAPAVVRQHQCGANEVITGATQAFVFSCTAINTTRYALAAPQAPCYFGSGSSGSDGVARCGNHPHSWNVLHQNFFGSDGCTGQPYGALFVRQGGRRCRDMLAAQLLYNGTVAGDPAAGTPVTMYEP